MRRQNITRLIFIVIVSLVLLSGLYDSTYSSISSDDNIYIEESKVILDSFDVPEVIFYDLDGKEILLSNYKNQVIFLNFWASWCTPCKKEFPDLVRLMNKFNGQAILLAVSSDDNKTDIERFIKTIKRAKNNSNLIWSENIIIAWDKNKRITKDIFKTIKLPETIIISPEINGQKQKIVKKITGADIDWLGGEIMSIVRLLSQKK